MPLAVLMLTGREDLRMVRRSSDVMCFLLIKWKDAPLSTMKDRFGLGDCFVLEIPKLKNVVCSSSRFLQLGRAPDSIPKPEFWPASEFILELQSRPSALGPCR